MPVPIRPKTREIFDFLKQCAAEKRIVTYTEVGDKVGLIARAVSNPHLYYIGGECSQRGLPPLDALVVREGSRLPGAGFNGGVPVTREEHNAMVSEVFIRDWSNVNLSTS